MTSNQIALGRLREDTRHHGQEEKLGFGTLGETRRHNVATESLGFSTLGETSRHNRATESLGFANVGLGYANLGEQTRHNIASEDYQGQQARAYAQRADAEATKIQLDIAHYLDQLEIERDKADAALSQATTAAQRAEIEQQLADIKKEMVFWEKLRIGAEAGKDIATGFHQVTGGIKDIKSLIPNVGDIKSVLDGLTSNSKSDDNK